MENIEYKVRNKVLDISLCSVFFVIGLKRLQYEEVIKKNEYHVFCYVILNRIL